MLMVYDSSLITRSGPFTGVICFIICINNARLGHGSLSPRRALGLSDFDHVHSKGISGTARVWLAMYFFGCNAGVDNLDGVHKQDPEHSSEKRTQGPLREIPDVVRAKVMILFVLVCFHVDAKYTRQVVDIPTRGSAGSRRSGNQATRTKGCNARPTARDGPCAPSKSVALSASHLQHSSANTVFTGGNTSYGHSRSPV